MTDTESHRRLVSLKDLVEAALIPLFAATAWILPQSAWYSVASLVGRCNPFRDRRRRVSIERALGGGVQSSDGARIARENVAEAGLHRMYVLNEYRWRPRRPALTLEGAEHIDAALVAGSGAILWVTPFCHADLMAKRAIHSGGYEVSHLSRPEHRGGPTRFGMRFLAPLHQRIENRYLGRRIMMEGGSTVPAMRELMRRLRKNELISITVLDTATQRVDVPFVRPGVSLALARGPVTLALRTGAPLLPVFAVRNGTGSFEVSVRPALDVGSADPSTGQTRAFHEYSRLLEERVRAYPGQWWGWSSLTFQDGLST